MSNEKNERHDDSQESDQHRRQNGSRSIFSVTMDPSALEQELDQAAQALHSTVNTLLNTMQSSVFGGLETLSREMSALEKNSQAYLEDHPNQFPWSFKTDGPKKRYRITIEELPPADDHSSSPAFSTSSARSEDDFTVTQGKAGTADEGKTFITASVAPGLLDWLLFTTHEDSFFRRLGGGGSEKSRRPEDDYDVVGETKITELKEGQDPMVTKEEQDACHKMVVPALVEKVKKVGTAWEKDARHWWQRGGQKEDKSVHEDAVMDHQHHLFSGTSQSSQDQQEEHHSRRWPRGGRSWDRSESYSQTTVTRPDGTVEHKVVNVVNGETETQIKIEHPDGSIETSVTRESGYEGHGHGPHQSHAPGFFKERWAKHRQDRLVHEGDVDEVAEENVNNAKGSRWGRRKENREEHEESSSSKSWPPKAWVQRQERDE